MVAEPLGFEFDQKVQCTYAFLQVAFGLIRKEVKSYQCAIAILIRFNVMRQSVELVGATCAIESLWKMLFLSPHPTVSNRVSSNRSLRCRETDF
jgi:hypothetical protein